ncbi:MAG: 4-hydroxy-3-methylbut-2-enyl diphosphate reductase [Alphaproteobacteria bacterium]|nr:4-hydroxy-3-methylbut-2-enyl diphosphate reductase [Alphaproteobacteria bacterium]OJV45810.1 MAG: 4-hydroxy-3-methylbut-2-enyl diphosphate reductase [Alphaproteobacteria bacterium 43-37]
MMKPAITIILAEPRGFCAGVDRAIQIVEKAIEKFGRPIYVRHEIVHNRHVVEKLEALGAVFVEELDQVPENSRVIFSAHGVPKSVPAEAKRRELFYLDATCPLVSKVHREAEHLFQSGHLIFLIGHKGHPEVVGTMGQLPEGAVILIQTLEDVENLVNINPEKCAFVTQTTLSVDETFQVSQALRARFPHISEPKREDICYATTNRQTAVKKIAPLVERMIVIGAPNSSNSVRLVEVSKAYGCPESRLCSHVDQVDWDWLKGSRSLGLTAGASAPEELVEGLIEACRSRFDVSIETVKVAEENVNFNLPRVLNDQLYADSNR